jgi:hypothetical protein
MKIKPIIPLQMWVVGDFLEKHEASDDIMKIFQAICEELVEGQKPITNYRSDEIDFLKKLSSNITKIILGQKNVSDLSWMIHNRIREILTIQKTLI